MPRAKSDVIPTLQEPQWSHQRVTSRDPTVCSSATADPPAYSSRGGSTASSPRSPSSPRKDPPTRRHSPMLNGQKLQGSPSHSPRPSLASITSLAAQAAVPKSKFSDVKYKKTSEGPCSQESPRSRSRPNKPRKELKEHKKMKEPTKRERTAEERKRRKKKEEKRLAERRKKREKTVNKERKVVLKGEPAEKEKSTPPSSSEPRADFKQKKAAGPPSQHQAQPPLKHKHRIRRKQAEKKHRSPTATVSQLSSKSTNPKINKKASVLAKAAPREKLKDTNSRSQTTKKPPSIVLSQSEGGSRSKGADTLPTLLFKALAPLTAGCSVSLERPLHGKDGGPGGLLNAPDLQPVAVMGSFQELGDNPANTPPVLSWQGSPVSTLGEDEEELEKGVLIRPVLQPSPTQCFSPPPPNESDASEYSNKEALEDALGGLGDGASERVPEESSKGGESGREASGSPKRRHWQCQAGLDDVLKSLTNFVEDQRATCRGGPFGGPANGSNKGVKSCSSLALGPSIPSIDSGPKLDPEASSQLPTHFTSDSLAVTDPTECGRKEEQEGKKNHADDRPQGEETKEKMEGSVLEGSLSARLRLTATATSISSRVLAKEGGESDGTDRKRKQKARAGAGEEEIKIKIRAVESRVLCSKIQVNENGISKGRESAVISRDSPHPLKSAKSQIPQENQTPHSKDSRRSNKSAVDIEVKEDGKLKVKAEERENLKSSSTLKSPSSSVAGTINLSKVHVSAPAGNGPGSAPVDPLKLKALSLGVSKELRILLVKVKSTGRQTFNISELEEQKIPLSKISIVNTASEVVSACR